MESEIPESRKAAERIIAGAKDMAAAPPVVFKLMTLLKKTNQHNQDIVDIIRYDENLTAKLLKLCNTAFFRATVPIDSVDQAVLRLGSSNILGIVAALSMEENLSKSKRTAYMNPYEIWRQSITTSIAAKQLAVKVRKTHIEPDLAFTIGLLHNIGMVVINAYPSEDIARIIPLAQQKGLSLIEAEREVLGTDHAEVGSLLIERWQLPPVIIEAIRCQHAPNTTPNPCASLCHLAGLCGYIATGIYPREQFKFTDFAYPCAFENLGLSEEDILGTIQAVQNESAQIEAFMMVA